MEAAKAPPTKRDSWTFSDDLIVPSLFSFLLP